MRACRTTVVLTLIALQLTAGAVAAGGQVDHLKDTTPEQRAKLQTELMTSRLDLRADQTPKVADLNLKYAKKMEPVIKGSAGPFMRMRQMKEITQDKEAELKQILSPAQFEKYLASKDEMREKFAEKIEGRAEGRE